MLADRLALGPFTIGQILVRPTGGTGSELRHTDDASAAPEGLKTSEDPLAARRISLETEDGAYRPLKGSPDLRRGWRLVLADLDDVRLALEGFYPGALALWRAWTAGTLRVVPLADTLERQTGMYRFAKTISPEGAGRVTEARCLRGCLRIPLWSPHAGPVTESSSHVPLVCPEACSFLVADARVASKAEFEAREKETAGNPVPEG